MLDTAMLSDLYRRQVTITPIARSRQQTEQVVIAFFQATDWQVSGWAG
jgi:hypothetical protein